MAKHLRFSWEMWYFLDVGFFLLFIAANAQIGKLAAPFEREPENVAGFPGDDVLVNCVLKSEYHFAIDGVNFRLVHSDPSTSGDWSLYLMNINVNQHDGYYHCQYELYTGGIDDSHKGEVIVVVAPTLSMTFNGDDVTDDEEVTVEADDTEEFKCKAQGGNPDPLFSWFVDLENITDSAVQDGTDTSILNHAFKPGEDGDNGAILQCRVFVHELLRMQFLNKTLNVKCPPRFLGEDNCTKEAEVGESLILETAVFCSKPQFTSASWTWDDNNIIHDRADEITHNERIISKLIDAEGGYKAEDCFKAELHIIEVNRDDFNDGKLTFVIENILNEIEVSCHIDILGHVEIAGDGVHWLNPNEGDFSFSQSFESLPKFTVAKWSWKEQELQHSSEGTVVDGRFKSELTSQSKNDTAEVYTIVFSITDIEFSDVTDYMLYVENGYESDEFTVSLWSEPFPPETPVTDVEGNVDENIKISLPFCSVPPYTAARWEWNNEIVIDLTPPIMDGSYENHFVATIEPDGACFKTMLNILEAQETDSRTYSFVVNNGKDLRFDVKVSITRKTNVAMIVGLTFGVLVLVIITIAIFAFVKKIWCFKPKTPEGIGQSTGLNNYSDAYSSTRIAGSSARTGRACYDNATTDIIIYTEPNNEPAVHVYESVEQ